MTGEQKRRITDAVKIVERYRRSLIEKMAAEIVEHREDFENPFLGGAESIVDKYHHHLSCLYAVTSELSALLPRQSDRRPPPHD